MPIVVPVIVRFAVREAPVVFAATEKLTTPLPVPEAPEVMVRNAALLLAVHAQPLFVVTVMDADPPAAGERGRRCSGDDGARAATRTSWRVVVAAGHRDNQHGCRTDDSCAL